MMKLLYALLYSEFSCLDFVSFDKQILSNLQIPDLSAYPSLRLDRSMSHRPSVLKGEISRLSSGVSCLVQY